MSAASRSVPRVECPWCARGPLPAKRGVNVCSGCGETFHV